MVTKRGTAGDDVLTGTDLADKLYGLDGNDTLIGLKGNDFLDGGDGYNIVRGGDGDDTILNGDGGGELFGFAGNDKITGGTYGSLGDVVAHGGNGNDTISLYSEDRAEGFGDDGDDNLDVRSDVDTLADGGRGNDRITCYSGNGASAFGRDGNDVIEVAGGIGGYASGGAGADTITAGEDQDEGVTLIGGSGNDHIYGMNEGTSLEMDGGYSDLIYGNSGNDWIHGRAGNDWISGGTARDVLRGGAGNDLFDVDQGDSVPGGNAADVIKGFDRVGRAAGDVIDLSDLSSATLIFRGTGAFTGIDQVRVHDVGTSTVVDVNLSGTAAPEAQIVIEDLASLASAYRGADFIL